MNKLSIKLALCLCFSFTGCGGGSQQDTVFEHKIANEFNGLDPETQKEWAPTELFESIYLNDWESFQRNLSNIETFDFAQKNTSDQDTALAVAIKLQRKKMVQALIAVTSGSMLLEKNSKGRSFVSLLVEHDMREEFEQAYELYRNEHQRLGALWMRNFDFKDDLGRRASFYAKSYEMIGRLEESWFQSVTARRHYFHRFYFDFDDNGNTFIHLAAQNGNNQVIRWFVDNFCNQAEIKEKTILGKVLRNVGNALADSEWTPFRRRYLNRQNDDDDTPMHLAARHGQVRSIEALMVCDYTDPTMVNAMGRTPVVDLLAHLDPNEPVLPENKKQAFESLMYEIDPVWTRIDLELGVGATRARFSGGFDVFNNFKRLVTTIDETCWTGMHYAAFIEDSYFWNRLERFQLNGTQSCRENSMGYTAEQLRKEQ